MSSVYNLLKELQFHHLETRLKEHLRNVYTTLGLSLIACIAGGVVHFWTEVLAFNAMTFFITIIISIGFFMTDPTQSNTCVRFSFLASFGFLAGVNRSGFVDQILDLDETILPSAILITSLVFIIVSVGALLCADQTTLGLGPAPIMDIALLLVLVKLNYTFGWFGVTVPIPLQFYLGIAVLAILIFGETQLAVLVFRQGEVDFTFPSLYFFIDFLEIFTEVVVILVYNNLKDSRSD